MALSRATADTVTIIIARCRRELGDPVLTPQGDVITNPGFSDADIRFSLNDTFKLMGQLLRSGHRGEALQGVHLTYTENSTRRGVALPSGISASAIYAVEDITDSSALSPRPLQYVDMSEIANYDRRVEGVDGVPFMYTLVVEALAYHIMVRPEPPAGRILRIWYAATPIIHGDVADTHALAAEWSEFIGVDAAYRLMSYDGSLTDDTRERRRELKDQFVKFATRNRGHQRVRMANRGVF